MDLPTIRYTIVVPNGIEPGDEFPACIYGKSTIIRCPKNSPSGSLLQVNVVSTNIENQLLKISRYRRFDDEIITDRIVYESGLIWMFIVLLIMITLTMSVAPFFTQKIDISCNVINKKTGNSIHRLYFFLFQGLSSSYVNCNDENDNFW